jgi:hypothetical protein
VRCAAAARLSPWAIAAALRDQPVGGELRQQPADCLAMGAQHRVAQPPIPEQRQHLGGTGVNPERRDGFDLQQAVACHRLDGLVAAYRRAAQDPVDRVVLQADHQPLGLATSLG